MVFLRSGTGSEAPWVPGLWDISPRLNGNLSNFFLCLHPHPPHRLCPSADPKVVHQESDVNTVIALRETH